MSPIRQGAQTVSVPYLIRPKLGSNTVSTDSGSWDGGSVRTREVLSCPMAAVSCRWILYSF